MVKKGEVLRVKTLNMEAQDIIHLQESSHQLTNDRKKKMFMGPNVMPAHSDPTNSVLLTSSINAIHATASIS